MLKKLATLLLVLSEFTTLSGATYYISPTGNDTTGNGSPGSPWKTYNRAATNLVAGDILLVQPGIYPVAGNTNDSYGTPYCRFLTVGTSNAPITLRANGPVTNRFGFEFSVPYYYIDGFTWDGDYSGGMITRTGSGHMTVTNCTFQNGQHIGITSEPPDSGQGGLPETAPSYCTIIDSRFLQLTNGGCVTLFGVNNLCQGNLFANGGAQDSIYIFGSNNVIRLNTFTNMATAVGVGNHPDILQTFGNNGFWMVNALFEQNYVVNCPIQLMNFEMRGDTIPGITVQTNNSYWGMVLRNNVFEDSDMQCSIDVPNIRFYNNTFRRCGHGGALINFGFWDWSWNAWKGVATGGAVVNNAFIDCGGTYAPVSVGPSQADLTNSAAAVRGRANVIVDSGIYYVWGVYSNLVGTITSGTLYCPAGDLYTVDATNFSSGMFNVAIQHTDPANGIPYATGNSNQAGYINNGTLQFRINTDSYPIGEIATIMGLYVANTSSISNNSDYNYNGWATEPHGLSGGDVNLVATNGWPAALASPMLGSVLIDAGTNLSNFGIIKDFSGTARPQGSGFDIGAFEYSGSAPPAVPPTINLQPQSITTNAGASAIFSVGATGTASIGYQWLLNGTSIPGATTSILLKSNVQLADAGAYAVVVTNSGGSTSSTTAILTVLPSTPVPPAITLQPQRVTTNLGASAVFSVAVSGTAPLAFRWSFNGQPIAGASSAVFTIANVQTNNAGAYSALVSNSAGSAASADALLTVIPATEASAQHYVSMTGNDSTGDGTMAKPWRTIAKAIGMAVAGDTVNIGPGDYGEYTQSELTGGTAGNYIRFVANPPRQAILRSFRLRAPYIYLDSLVFSNYCGANNLDASCTRIEAAAHDCVITNCVYTHIPYVKASDFSFSTNGGNKIVSASSDFQAAGFMPGAWVYLGACGMTNPLSFYTNHDTTWLVSDVQAHTLSVTNGAGDRFAYDSGSNYWAMILASSGNGGYSAILEIAVGDTVPDNTVIRGNVIKDWCANGIGIRGDGARIENNLFTNFLSYPLLDLIGNNILVRSNIFRYGPTVLYYWGTESAQLTHPAGVGWWDFFAAQINSEPNAYFPVNTNNSFCWNYMEGFDSQLGAVYDAGLPDTHTFWFTNNIFVGIAGYFNIGRDDTHWQNNTMYRCINVDNPLVMGGRNEYPAQTNYVVTGNLLIDCGPKSIDDRGAYGLYLPKMTNYTIDYNMMAGPETRGYPSKILNYHETNGINGGDPVFYNSSDILGPDGIPFTADDGLQVLPNSPAAAIGGGALGVYRITTNVPVAHFRLLSPTNWCESEGLDYDPVWAAQRPGDRTHVIRPWDTVPMIGTNVTAVWDATYSISATHGATTNLGIAQYVWTIEGARTTNSTPFKTNTFSSGGTKAVVLTVYNTAGNSASTRNYYRLGGGTKAGPPMPTGLHFVGFGP